MNERPVELSWVVKVSRLIKINYENVGWLDGHEAPAGINTTISRASNELSANEINESRSACYAESHKKMEARGSEWMDINRHNSSSPHSFVCFVLLLLKGEMEISAEITQNVERFESKIVFRILWPCKFSRKSLPASSLLASLVYTNFYCFVHLKKRSIWGSFASL